MHAKKSRLPSVPVFHLYGETGSEAAQELVHCESIASRSRLHNWEIQPHRHHGLFQMLWLARGRADVAIDDGDGRLSAGQVLLLPQHCVHGFRFAPGADGTVMTFSYLVFDRLQSALGSLLREMRRATVCRLAESPDRWQIEITLRAMLPAYAGADKHRALLIEAQLVSLLVWLSRLLPVSDQEPPLTRGRAHLARFTQLIETSFIHHLPLEDYAAKLGISAAHLNALCRQLTHHSALALIHARVSLEAKRQLTYTSLPVRSIAESLGFSDPAYFTRFFKRQTGVSPAAFRAQALAAGKLS